MIRHVQQGKAVEYRTHDECADEGSQDVELPYLDRGSPKEHNGERIKQKSITDCRFGQPKTSDEKHALEEEELAVQLESKGK